MPQFIALTSKGLRPVLKKELQDLNFKVLKETGEGVLFDGSWNEAIRANHELRTCTRILKPVADFQVYNADELYNHCKKIDFTKFFDVDQTFAIKVKGQSPFFNNTLYAAQLMKDAIVDQFQKKYQKRPNVNKEKPAIEFYCRLQDTQVSISLNTSGTSLTHHGYRDQSVHAPIREHIAAALLKHAGIEDYDLVWDPMCGSGTFIYEAHEILNDNFIPRDLPIYKWKHLKQMDLKSPEKKHKAPLDHYYLASDVHPESVAAAKTNLDPIRSSHLKIRQGDFEDVPFDKLDLKFKKGLLVINPPYAERLGEIEKLKPTYKRLGDFMKQRLKGWDVWIVSGQAQLTKELRLKSDRQLNFDNGGISCRWLRYSMY